MFWPENLVLACFACNTDLKKAYDPVVTADRPYRVTEFSVVHPYLDDPAEHIKYAAEGLLVLISPCNGSPKGRQTIDLFDLTSAERTKQRAKDALFDSDVDHLDGPWLQLYQEAAVAILQERFTTKLTS